MGLINNNKNYLKHFIIIRGKMFSFPYWPAAYLIGLTFVVTSNRAALQGACRQL